MQATQDESFILNSNILQPLHYILSPPRIDDAVIL